MSSSWTPNFSEQLGFPDMDVDRVLWNAAFETHMEKMQRLDFIRQARGCAAIMYPDDRSIQGLLMNIRTRQTALCLWQRDLTRNATRWFAEDDFEARWLQSKASVCQTHLLEGIARTCSGPDSYEECRIFCPEVTLAYLLQGNGNGFLRLLKSVMVEDTSSVPSIPIFLPNPRFDAMIGERCYQVSEEERRFQYHYTLAKNEFIGHFLFNTLASFQGYTCGPRLVKKHSVADGIPDGKFKDCLKAMYGESGFATLQHNHSAARKARVAFCENIVCENSGDSAKFSVCASCKANQGRKMYYCSRVCQKADWKRHRPICGKEVNLEEAVTSSAPSGQPDPRESAKLSPDNSRPEVTGYKRSPALQHQVALLNSYPDVDYFFFVFGSNQPQRPVILRDHISKNVFGEFRRKATVSGDHAAVCAIAQFVAETLVNELRLTPDIIMSQLKREYQFDVETAVEELNKHRARDPRKLIELEKARFEALESNVVLKSRSEGTTNQGL